jgi:hypothetical protein
MQQSGENQGVRPPVPPFDEETARQKVKAAQDAWNTRDPEKVSLAYTEDSKWRNRDEFFEGREAIRDFLTRKWARELDYRLEKNLWCFTGNRIASGSSTRAGMRRDTGGEVMGMNCGSSMSMGSWEARCLDQRLQDRGVRAQVSLGQVSPSAKWAVLS